MSACDPDDPMHWKCDQVEGRCVHWSGAAETLDAVDAGGGLRVPTAAEWAAPRGQAARWLHDVVQHVSACAIHTARQVARLCGDDSLAAIPWRSLADAVSTHHYKRRKGEHGKRAYASKGVELLERAGWLRVETTGTGRGARTTFYLVPGDLERSPEPLLTTYVDCRCGGARWGRCDTRECIE